MAAERFSLNGTDYDYFPSHGHNNPAENERRVQLPIAMQFIDNHAEMMEIGAVTPYYRDSTHPVYDATDGHDRAIKADARDLKYEGKNVLSISVMQFVGGGGYGDLVGDGPQSAIDLVKRITEGCESCCLTWPNGYNAPLDEAVFAGEIDHVIFLQRDKHNNWQQTDDPTLREYDKPFKSGNSIVVLQKEP